MQHGDEIHPNVHEFLHLSWGFVAPSLPSVIANLREVVQCCPEFQIIEDSIVCHVMFPKWPVRHQITDSSNPMID